jgi:hypothetical protein
MLVAQGALIFGALAGLGVIKNIDAAEVVDELHLGRGWCR